MSRAGTKEKVILYAIIVVLAGLNLVQHSGQPQPTPGEVSKARQHIIDQFHLLYYGNADTWATSRWLGVLTQ